MLRSNSSSVALVEWRDSGAVWRASPGPGPGAAALIPAPPPSTPPPPTSTGIPRSAADGVPSEANAPFSRHKRLWNVS